MGVRFPGPGCVSLFGRGGVNYRGLGLGRGLYPGGQNDTINLSGRTLDGASNFFVSVWIQVIPTALVSGVD